MPNKYCYFQPSPLSSPELTPKERVWKLLHCRNNHFRGAKMFIPQCISGWPIQQRILLIKADHPPAGMPHACKFSQVALVVKNLAASEEDVRDAGVIPGSGRSPGGGQGNPLQYSCLESPHEQKSLWSTGSQRVGYDRSNLAHTQAGVKNRLWTLIYKGLTLWSW